MLQVHGSHIPYTRRPQGHKLEHVVCVSMLVLEAIFGPATIWSVRLKAVDHELLYKIA
jgi:hypothetical protein